MKCSPTEKSQNATHLAQRVATQALGVSVAPELHSWALADGHRNCHTAADDSKRVALGVDRDLVYVLHRVVNSVRQELRPRTRAENDAERNRSVAEGEANGVRRASLSNREPCKNNAPRRELFCSRRPRAATSKLPRPPFHGSRGRDRVLCELVRAHEKESPARLVHDGQRFAGVAADCRGVANVVVAVKRVLLELRTQLIGRRAPAHGEEIATGMPRLTFGATCRVLRGAVR